MCWVLYTAGLSLLIQQRMVSYVPKYFSIFTPYISEGICISANSAKVKALQFINCDVTATCRDTRDFGLETPSNINQVSYFFAREKHHTLSI